MHTRVVTDESSVAYSHLQMELFQTKAWIPNQCKPRLAFFTTSNSRITSLGNKEYVCICVCPQIQHPGAWDKPGEHP